MVLILVAFVHGGEELFRKPLDNSIITYPVHALGTGVDPLATEAVARSRN